MRYAVITLGRAGSSELIDKLIPKINVVRKPDNHLYPDKLFQKYGGDIKVIFLTRNIKDIIRSVLQREEDRGIKWTKQHYKNLNSDFKNYSKILEEDTLNFENLYDSYLKQKYFDVLFIKYENLFFNHKETLDALYKFTKLNYIDIRFNENNRWRGKYESKKNDKFELSWDKALQTKLDSYNIKLYKNTTKSSLFINLLKLIKRKIYSYFQVLKKIFKKSLDIISKKFY